MNTDSYQQINPIKNTYALLSEIEVAIETTENPQDITELLWVRDMLREHIAKDSHSVPIQ